MATGDSSDVLARIKMLLPRRWFPDDTPVLDALLSGAAWALSFIIATTLAGTTTLTQVLKFENDGGIDTPGVTGGSCGAGCLNVSALKVNNVAVLSANQTITLSGDASGSGATAITVTNSKVNGVSYGSSPSTNTVPVITSSNTATYEALPLAAMASVNANNVLGATTTGVPAALSLPSCSGASNALIWTAGTGFGCNTISGSGNGTVNNGTTPDLSYYASSTNAVSDATGLQYNATTKGLNMNGVNAHSLPDNGTDTTGVAIGGSAYLNAATTGQNGTAVGYQAMMAVTTGVDNTALGSGAGKAWTTDSYNFAAGQGAGATQAGIATTASTGNISIGYQAATLANAPIGNVVIGSQAMASHTTAIGGGSNVIIGDGAASSENGNVFADNVIVGQGAVVLQSGHNGFEQNVMIGQQVNGNNTVTPIAQNVMIGTAAGYGTAAGDETFVGYDAGASVSGGGNNTLIGWTVGASTLTSGTSNVIVGTSGETTALSNTSSFTGLGSGVKGGSSDVAIGAQALHATATNNNDNVAVGYSALAADTTGLGNVAIGFEAGDTGTNNCTVCTNTTLVGYEAALGSTATNNANAFGYEAVAQASNDVTLGNSSIATIHAEVTTITAISDRRHKTDVKPLDLGLVFVDHLKPVSYRLKTSKGIERFGFIAQDTEAALPSQYRSIVGDRKENDRLALIEIQNNKEGTYRMGYDELLAPLVKAIQDLKAANDNQQKEIDELKARIKAGN